MWRTTVAAFLVVGSGCGGRIGESGPDVGEADSGGVRDSAPAVDVSLGDGGT